MTKWLTATGTLKITQRSIRLLAPPDICAYYKYLIEQYHYQTVKIQYPRYPAHVTIVNKHFQHHAKADCLKFRELDGKKVVFEYSNDIRIGGRTKNFTNFYLLVHCELADQIKKDLKIQENRPQCFHITIANNKNI